MSFSIVKIIPQQVVSIGDDGKNRSSHLFDESLDTRWSYKGGFAYNLITLKDAVALDSLTFHWYMKKKERRVYEFGVFTSNSDVSFSGDFDAIKQEIQEIYDRADTIKSSNEDGKDTSVVQFNGTIAKTILIIYTHSSSKKSWFSVKEIEIMGRSAAVGSQCPDGQKWDPILGECKPIMTDTDEFKVDGHGVMFWDDEVGSYLSLNETFSRNFRTDGSMRLDVEQKDMGGKWRPDKEIVVFLKVSGKNPKEEVSAKLDGGPHNDKNPELGRCYDIGVSFDAKRLRLRVEDKHPHMIDYEEIDLTKLGLPALTGMWYGFCFTDRRVLQQSNNKLLGRILSVRVNPNPFDYNRNVQNDNWIDIGAFLDKGQYKLPIIEGPVDPEKYTDTIRVDGQDASTFGHRFLRYCQVEPIIVESAEEMETAFSQVREDTEEDAPAKENNLADIEATIPDNLVVGKEDELVRLRAKITPNPIITKVQWRQSSGKQIPIPPDFLDTDTVEFRYKAAYGNTEWTFSALAMGGVSVYEKTIKIINAIDETKDYISPLYPNVRTGFRYAKAMDLSLSANDSFGSGEETFTNFEFTTVMTIGKANVAHPYTVNMLPYIYEIYTNGKYTSGQNTYPYMTNIPSLKGKKVGLKIVAQTTNMVIGGKTQKATLVEFYLNLNTNESKEYSPWFKSIQQPLVAPVTISVVVPTETHIEKCEIREIQPTSEIRNI